MQLERCVMQLHVRSYSIKYISLNSLSIKKFKIPWSPMHPSVSSKAIQKARQMAKRNRTSVACGRCKSAKTKCSDYRPCKQCVESKSCCKEVESMRSSADSAGTLNGAQREIDLTPYHKESSEYGISCNRNFLNSSLLNLSKLPEVSGSSISGYNIMQTMSHTSSAQSLPSFQYPVTNFCAPQPFRPHQPQSVLPPALSALLLCSMIPAASPTFPTSPAILQLMLSLARAPRPSI